MSREMIERVARTLNAEVFDPEVLRVYGDIWAYDSRDKALERARAMIEAMRDPTKAMIAAGWIDKEDVNPDDIWRAMIEEALK